jgi:hypothetical protein
VASLDGSIVSDETELDKLSSDLFQKADLK